MRLAVGTTTTPVLITIKTIELLLNSDLIIGSTVIIIIIIIIIIIDISTHYVL